jgi:uncharacterized protein (TIGR00730 family)
MDDKRPQKPMMDEPLTLAKINRSIKERAEKIADEIRDGLNFIKDSHKSVTFFGSARTRENEKDYQLARSLAGKIVKELGYTVVTGASSGIMEAANRGAYENDGNSIGLNIRLETEQKTNDYMTSHMSFHYFFTRKMCMAFSAEAYVFFPGGYGTLDELFEILTLIQTNKIEKVPVILVGQKFWKELDIFIKEMLLKTEKIDAEDMNLYTITDNEDEIVDIIRNAPIRTVIEE